MIIEIHIGSNINFKSEVIWWNDVTWDHLVMSPLLVICILIELSYINHMYLPQLYICSKKFLLVFHIIVHHCLKLARKLIVEKWRKYDCIPFICLGGVWSTKEACCAAKFFVCRRNISFYKKISYCWVVQGEYFSQYHIALCPWC